MDTKTNYDIAVIGSGPGGYIAAIRCAQLGYNTAIIEKYAALGGTCTNVGCIPAKALLDSTEHYHNALHKFALHGIDFDALAVNFSRLMARREEVVKQNVAGLEYLMKKNKITVIRGTASFVDSSTVNVVSGEGGMAITAANFIIATGSKPSTIPGVELDKKRIISSTEALSLSEKPGSMAIIGGGVIGVEMASIYARIGVKVTIIEYADQIIPTMDRSLGKELNKILTKQGIEILLNHKVKQAVNLGDNVSIQYLDGSDKALELTAEICLVAVGRKPYTTGLGLENTNIKVDQGGRIITNQLLRTEHQHIYAIGDVVAGPMLAHKAEEEGVFVAETINGQKPGIHYNLIPGVVYTWPEVASVGYTEEQLKLENKPYKVGKFPFSASGRARAAMETDGFVKVLVDPEYGELRGIHIIGPRAADLIAQPVTGMYYEITDEDMFRMIYAHPTYAEAIKEACLIASGQGALNL